jgi:hypothetical protein
MFYASCAGRCVSFPESWPFKSREIALGESWAYHMGFYLANQKYNVENAAKGDPIVYVQNTSLNSGTDLVSLENYRPQLSGGQFNWIPKGLMLDLMDNGEQLLTQVTV